MEGVSIQSPGHKVSRKRKARSATENDNLDEAKRSSKRKKAEGAQNELREEKSCKCNGNEGASTTDFFQEHTPEEVAEWKKRKHAYLKSRLNQPKLFLVVDKMDGKHNSVPENAIRGKVWMRKRREPISLTEVFQLLQFALLGNRANSNPSWCKLLRVCKVSKVVLIVLNGVTSRLYRRKRHCFPNIAERSLSTKLIPACSYFAMIQDILSGRMCFTKFKKVKHFKINEILKERAAKMRMKNGWLKGGHANGDVADEVGNQADSMKDLTTRKTYYLLTPEEMKHRGFPSAQQKEYVHTNHAERVTNDSPICSLDCEMVLTSAGSELARISMVDEEGNTMYDSLVKPDNPVRDYITKYSGITKAMLDPVQTRLVDAQKAIIGLLPSDAILLGQGLENDLKSLKIYHPHCVDTCDMFSATNRKVKLKYLAKEYLHRDIQCSSMGHDSVEDARACLDLFKLKLSKGYRLRNYHNEVPKDFVFNTRESIFQTASEQHKKTTAVDTRFLIKKLSKEAVNCIVCSNDKEIVKKAIGAISGSDFVFMQLHGYKNLQQGMTMSEEDVESTLSLLDERVGSVIEALPPNSLHVTVMPGYAEWREQASASRGEYSTRKGRCVVKLKLGPSTDR